MGTPRLAARFLDRFQSRKRFAFQVLQRCPAPGADEIELLGQARLRDGRGGISASDELQSLRLRDRPRELESARGEGRLLENTHGSVPENRLEPREFFLEELESPRADVHAHSFVENLGVFRRRYVLRIAESFR